MRQTPPLLEMISTLIQTPSVSSVSPEFDMSNMDVVNLLANWLDNLGLCVQVQPLDGKEAKANLIARFGSGEDGLVLAGHTDTVPYDRHRWRYEPFNLTESNGRLYGLGTSDMKSFLALAIEALRAFQAKELKRPVTILATADEESTMAGAKHLVQCGAKLGRYCLIGEPTNLAPVRQHKGMFMEAIHLQGRSGHSSDPRFGNSALDGMVAVIQALTAFREELQARYKNPAFAVPTPTLNLGHIHGGDNPNRICGECELHIDLRPLPGMDIDELRQTLRDRVSRVAHGLDLQCAFRALFDGTPAMQTPVSSGIVQLVEELSGHASGAVAFCTEGPYFNSMGTDTVILGPGDIAQAHQPDEYLEVSRIAPMLELLKNLITRVCVDPDLR